MPIPLAAITDQTVLITARHPGQIVLLDGEVAATATAPEQVLRVHGTGTVELGWGGWDKAAIVVGDYRGDWFTGSQGVASITDPLPPLTAVQYRARAYNTDGGWADSDVVTVDATMRDCVLTLPDGTGMVRGGRVERAGQGRGRPTELVQLAGADRPTPFRARRLSAAALPVTVQLLPARNASTLDAWLDRLEHPGPLVYREPGGLLVAGTAVVDGWDPGDRFRAAVSFTITETVDAPRIR